MMYWLMVGYQTVVHLVDFLLLCFLSVVILFQSIYRIFYPPKMKSVIGEIILITGAGHGIGKELCVQFSRLGAKVICLDINEEWNKKTVAQITSEGGTAWGFACDVSSREEVKTVSDKIRNTVGDVTMLVNNAGIMPCKPLCRTTSEEIEKLFKVNVFSQIWMIQEWLPTFKSNKRGHIVAMSSMCGVIGTANLVPYCASKFAVTGLMDALQEELRYGDQYPNIKCTRIHPYTVNTGLALKPRVKFPYFNSLVPVDDCASWIVDCVRREYDIVFIPYRLFYIHKLIMMMPRKFQLAVIDFMDTGVDAHDN